MIYITQFFRRPYSGAFSIERLYADVRLGLTSSCRVNVVTCKRFSRGFWARMANMLDARRYQGDVNHITGDVHYLTFLLPKAKTVLTIHDLVLLTRLSGWKYWAAWLLWYWIPVWRSRVVVTVSDATKDALVATLRCDPDKVRVVHHCVSRDFYRAPKLSVPEVPRILQVGTGQNKNLMRVVEALRGVLCTLVIVGVLNERQRSWLTNEEVVFENYVELTSGQLVDEYVKSDLVIFASTFEGFGLPIVEAQAVGRPVVTSKISPMCDVAGENACLVDPFCVNSIRDGIVRTLSDPAYRDMLVKAGFSNVARFSLAHVAAEYEKIYKEVALRLKN
jgi:glycosyltransferase involved in cell wall biosynthesis